MVKRMPNLLVLVLDLGLLLFQRRKMQTKFTLLVPTLEIVAVLQNKRFLLYVASFEVVSFFEGVVIL